MLDSSERVDLQAEDRERRFRKRIADGLDDQANRDLAIPARFKGKSLSNLVGLDAEANKCSGAIDSGKGAFIFGTCGLGKTHMACGALRDWYSRRLVLSSMGTGDAIRGHFQSVTEFVFACKATIGGTGSENGVIDKVLCGPYRGEGVGRAVYEVVILDDLVGAPRTSPYTVDLISALVDRIYTRCKPVPIITSNFDLDGVAKFIDDRTASRIAEMCVVVGLKGQDRRLGAK